MAELEATVERLMVKVTLDINANMQEFAPVDTGWLQANFVPNVGVSNYDTFGDPENIFPATAAQKEGLADVLGYRLGQGEIRISNNVSYIEAVNENHPSKSKFIERAIEKALNDDIFGL